MDIKSYPTYRIKFSGIDNKNISEMINKLALLPLLPENDVIIIGIDLGYTEATAIVVLYEKSGQIYEHARINLVKVPYPLQEKLIDFLDTKLNPAMIGIDAGGPGKPLVQSLLLSDSYVHKQYDKRIVPVDFGSWISLGQDADGEEIKVKVKPYSITLLQEYTNSHKIIYSSTDMDLVVELERMTYTKNPSGDVVYRTLTPGGGQRGEDHNTSAMLCAVMAYFTKTEHRTFMRAKKPLMKPRWVVRGI
jgi:hypothetical protein